jgi:prophage endopeptidase
MINPWIIVGVILAMLGFYGYGHHKGWAERDAEMQSEIAIKNEEARTKEQELTKQLNENSSKLQEANNAITEKQSSLDRAIRAGRVRFPAAGCVQTNASAPAPSGGRNETGSESDRETLAAIAAIVAQGDRNTEQLNACITAYNQVMEKVNGQR